MPEELAFLECPPISALSSPMQLSQPMSKQQLWLHSGS
jgi:hypothetical protein